MNPSHSNVLMVGPNFRVGKKIGCGNFGELRLGTCTCERVECEGRGVRECEGRDVRECERGSMREGA